MRRLNRIGNEKLAQLDYNSLFLSGISYGLEAWGSCSKTYFEEVFRIQKKVARSIKGLKSREPCKNNFVDTGIMTLTSLYTYLILVYAKQEYGGNKLSPLNAPSHKYPTRKKEAIVTERSRTEKNRKCPSNMTIKAYNLLPKELREVKLKYMQRKY